jgi:hypothetical protein
VDGGVRHRIERTDERLELVAERFALGAIALNIAAEALELLEGLRLIQAGARLAIRLLHHRS